MLNKTYGYALMEMLRRGGSKTQNHFESALKEQRQSLKLKIVQL
jgi:hypothetical protein